VTLVDTSIWIDHFRQGDALLAQLLRQRLVVMHPFVLGELAIGNLPRRRAILADLQDLTQVIVAEHQEVMSFIEHERLFGTGIGYLDAHLLAATRLTEETTLWTRDKPLLRVAERLSLAARLTH
jgi:predicted nucleic acid-binding protein